MLDQHTLNELRSLILQKEGISFISPSDCQQIALSITKKLNKTISKTTIKRLFGFAAAKHNFSKFTINTLLEYVDSPENKIISKSIVSPTYKNATEDWKQIINKAKAISHATLNKTIEKCTIPYHLTISRKFLTQDFDFFYKSEFSFTSLIAPPGYGKSIALNHLVYDYFLKPQAKFHHDIILYINANDLFNEDGINHNFEVELKKKLGISKYKNLVNSIHNYHQKTGSKLIIIVDSFNDALSVHKDKQKTFESMVSFLCDIEESTAVKVIFSMRSYLWSRFQTFIRNSHYLKNKWFPGSNYHEQDFVNVNKLSDDEVNGILNNINPKTHKLVIPKVKDLLSYPFFIKFYYQLKSEYPKGEFKTSIILYEIYLRHILENIYKSNQYVEKLILCKKIIEASNYGHNGTTMNKKSFFYDFSTFKVAYMELLSIGILKEYKLLENSLLSETVGFSQQHVFEYFLFKELLELNQNSLNIEFYQIITTNYPDKIKFELLRWAIFTAARNSNYDFIALFFELTMDQQNESQLTLFIAENIKHQLKHKPSDILAIKREATKNEAFAKMTSYFSRTVY